MNGTKGRFLYGLRSWQETEKEACTKRAEHVCGLLEGNTWNKKNKDWNKTKRGWNSGVGWTEKGFGLKRDCFGLKIMFWGSKKGQHMKQKGSLKTEAEKKKKCWNKKKRRKGRRWTEQRLNRKEGKRWSGRLNEIFWAFFFPSNLLKKNYGELVCVGFNF